MDSAKRKRADYDDAPEERLFKKFEVLESRLMQLWGPDSNSREDSSSIESVDASCQDLVSLEDRLVQEEIDDEVEQYSNNEDEYNESCIELPRESPPIEEVDLSDDELSNIWENAANPVEEPPPDEDVVFLNEGTIKTNGFLPQRETSLHPDIRETWTVWTRKGIPFKDREELLEKYTPPKFLKTPTVNPEILVTLHKRPIEKDEFVRSSQELVSSALTALGSVMSTLLTENDYDKLKVLNSLNDTAKILTELFHFDTDKRRSNIISWKPQPVQSLLVSTKPDELLFGKNLRNKINDAQKSGKLGELKPYVFKRNNNRPYRYFPSPYHWHGSRQENNEDDKDFVLNPLKQEAQDAKFVCKMEKIEKCSTVKIE